MRTARHIGIFLFADVEELDAVGPWEVLSYWTRTWPDDGCRVVTFSERAGEVCCAKGMTVWADHGEADRPKLDVLVYRVVRFLDEMIDIGVALLGRRAV